LFWITENIYTCQSYIYYFVHGYSFFLIYLQTLWKHKDEIAWHTDGRKFLGKRPTIGSLSLGAPATFEMRRMRNCWPCVAGTADSSASHDDGIDRLVPLRTWKLGDGDLFAMRGETQDHWHHRVPKVFIIQLFPILYLLFCHPFLMCTGYL